jgi:hypothetical protein
MGAHLKPQLKVQQGTGVLNMNRGFLQSQRNEDISHGHVHPVYDGSLNLWSSLMFDMAVQYGGGRLSWDAV